MAAMAECTEHAFVETICKCAEVTPEALAADWKSRKRELVEARQMHMLARVRIFKLSFTEAASIYRKDHATAHHAVRTMCNLHTDPVFRAKTDAFWNLYFRCGGELG